MKRKRIELTYGMGLSIIAAYLALYEFRNQILRDNDKTVLRKIERLYPGILKKAGFPYETETETTEMGGNRGLKPTKKVRTRSHKAVPDPRKDRCD